MITQAKFKYALKDMMKTMPLSDINVTELCKRCGCHRQTFYYHYQDIYDLVAAIFLSEDLSKMEKATDVRGVLRGFLSYSQGNLPFLIATYNSAARDLTEDFRNQDLTEERFVKKMRATIKLIDEVMVPAILAMSHKEEGK